MRLAGVAISLFLALGANSASAEVLAVCGEPNREPAALSQVRGITPARVGQDPQLALTRDGAGFDIVMNWGDSNQRSLRSSGAAIMGDQLDENFIHVVVARMAGESLEHFVFNLEESGPGELLWSASGFSADGAVTLASACVKPK